MESAPSSIKELLEKGQSAGRYAQTLRHILRKMDTDNSRVQVKSLEQVLLLGQQIAHSERDELWQAPTIVEKYSLNNSNFSSSSNNNNSSSSSSYHTHQTSSNNKSKTAYQKDILEERAEAELRAKRQQHHLRQQQQQQAHAQAQASAAATNNTNATNTNTFGGKGMGVRRLATAAVPGSAPSTSKKKNNKNGFSFGN